MSDRFAVVSFCMLFVIPFCMFQVWSTFLSWSRRLEVGIRMMTNVSPLWERWKRRKPRGCKCQRTFMRAREAHGNGRRFDEIGRRYGTRKLRDVISERNGPQYRAASIGPVRVFSCSTRKSINDYPLSGFRTGGSSFGSGLERDCRSVL